MKPLAYIRVVLFIDFADLKISHSPVEERRTKEKVAQMGLAMKILFVI